ncbi:class I SAM-dependent methyltransferase [Thauera sp.]|jgi:SAM-dependent methyltransferase|uniref:class I SAM-dependent methyltransferase n=1 Tax=Thauera sp. TaxID=1905334 RepID=UPI002A36D3DB|nr:class I SAM-dependent methyltransferase [Thauera sp.]MDX9885523.1 class I SAM-dependent methyltransferase [Thauera sp.]
MKARDSGMPDEAWWETFFDADEALRCLLPEAARTGDLVEFGCGYGTFTLAAARRIAGTVSAFDIEPDMVARVQARALGEGLRNIRAQVRDFVHHGSGLADRSQAHAMIYNLLHLEQPVDLLRETHRILATDASLSVIHWRSDIPTPRGPALSIRPTPAQCRQWMHEAGFSTVVEVALGPSCPYHFGLLGRA